MEIVGGSEALGSDNARPVLRIDLGDPVEYLDQITTALTASRRP